MSSLTFPMFLFNRQLEGELEARNDVISHLRDYVVDSGRYLLKDKPFF